MLTLITIVTIGYNRGFGFCAFRTMEDMERVLRELQMVDGKVVNITIAKTKPSERRQSHYPSESHYAPPHAHHEHYAPHAHSHGHSAHPSDVRRGAGHDYYPHGGRERERSHPEAHERHHYDRERERDYEHHRDRERVHERDHERDTRTRRRDDADFKAGSDRDRERDRERDRDRDRERDRERAREYNRERDRVLVFFSQITMIILLLLLSLPPFLYHSRLFCSPNIPHPDRRPLREASAPKRTTIGHP